MKICFVLERFTRRAIGGYKIVYEYANGLANRGYQVSILYTNRSAFVNYKVPKKLYRLCSNIMTCVEPRWFRLNKSITKISGTSKNFYKKITDIDVCIATGVETVQYCLDYFSNSELIYLIQDFETWVRDKEEIYSTYNIGMRNVVVSNWLKILVDSHSSYKSVLIKNPIDLNVYRIKKPIELRKKHSIGLLYHTGEHKGLNYSIKTLSLLKEIYKDLEVYAFGTSEPNDEIPGLVKYIRDASQQETVEIYNTVSIFICSSLNEGYGLTGMEAMACGTVLISSDYAGVHEYGIDGYNCLLSPVREPEKMVNNIIKVFEDDNLKNNISRCGRESLKEFTWDKAISKLESVLNDSHTYD